MSSPPGHYRTRRSGISIETDHTVARFAWSAMSRCLETRRLFVLLTADKGASCLISLPKG
jgi:hypothetical protein